MLGIAILALSLQVVEVPYEAVLVKKAAQQVDSIAKWSKEHKTETGACVSKFRVSISNDGIYTFVIEELSPANIIVADSLSAGWTDLCGDSLPTLHTHLMYYNAVLEPSDMDWKLVSVPERQHIPFELIVVLDSNFVLFDVIPYSIKIKGK